MLETRDKVFFAHDILKEFKGHDAVKSLLARDDLSVLDLGCSLPWMLFCLYRGYNFKKLVGVDEKSEVELVEAEPPHVRKTANTVYQVFKRFIKKERRKIRKSKYLSKSAFRNTFQLHFETTLCNYFMNVNRDEFFDYIVLSNILHLFDEDDFETVFYSSVAKLKPGGLIFVRVTHADNLKTKPPYNHTGFTEASFLKLFDGFERIDTYLYKRKEENYIESLTYFGVKK